MGLEQCGQFVCQLCYRSTSLPPPPIMKPLTAPSEGPFNYCFAKNAAAAPLLVAIFLARPEYWIPRAQRCGGYEHGENSLLFSHDRRPPGSLALMKFVLVLCKQFGLPVQSRILDGLQFPFRSAPCVGLFALQQNYGSSSTCVLVQGVVSTGYSMVLADLSTRVTVGSFVKYDFKVVGSPQCLIILFNPQKKFLTFLHTIIAYL